MAAHRSCIAEALSFEFSCEEKLDSSHFGHPFSSKDQIESNFCGSCELRHRIREVVRQRYAGRSTSSFGGSNACVFFKDVSEPRAIVCLNALGVLWLFALECSFVALLQATVDECLPCLLYAKAWLRIPTGPFFVLRACETAGPNWKLWLLAPGSQAGVWPAGLSMLFRKSLFCIKLAVFVFWNWVVKLGGGCFFTQKGNGTVPLWFWFLRMGIKVNDQECDVLVKASWATVKPWWEIFSAFLCVGSGQRSQRCTELSTSKRRKKVLLNVNLWKKIMWVLVTRDFKGPVRPYFVSGLSCTWGHYLWRVCGLDLWAKACCRRFTTGSSGQPEWNLLDGYEWMCDRSWWYLVLYICIYSNSTHIYYIIILICYIHFFIFYI